MRSIRRGLLLGFVLTALASSQGVRAGLKLGVPVTTYFETGSSGGLHGSAAYSAATRRYTLGPAVEWRLTGSLGLEADALYHRMGYVAIVNTFDSANGAFRNSAIDVKGNSWDFPLLVKYRFGRATTPYVLGGAVLRHIGPVHGRGEQTVGSLVTNTRTTTALDTDQPSDLRKRFYPGVTAGAGLEFRIGPTSVLPEFRYTRWAANISGPGGLLRFSPNQAEFTLGVLF